MRPRRRVLLEPLEPRVLLSADNAIGGVTAALDVGFDALYQEFTDLLENDEIFQDHVPGFLITTGEGEGQTTASPTFGQAMSIDVNVAAGFNGDSGFDAGLAGGNSLLDRYVYVTGFAADWAQFISGVQGDELALDAMDIDRDGRTSISEAFGVLVLGQVEAFATVDIVEQDGDPGITADDFAIQLEFFIDNFMNQPGFLSDRLDLDVFDGDVFTPGSDVLFDLDFRLELFAPEQVDLGYLADELDIALDPGTGDAPGTPTKVTVDRALRMTTFLFGFNGATDGNVDPNGGDFYFAVPDGMRMGLAIDTGGDPVPVAGMQVNVGFLGTTVQNVMGDGFFLDMDVTGFADDPSHPDALGFDAVPVSGAGSLTAGAVPENVSDNADPDDDYVLDNDVVFTLRVGQGIDSPIREVTLAQSATVGNTLISELATNLEDAIDGAFSSFGLITVDDTGGKLRLSLPDVAPGQLGFAHQVIGVGSIEAGNVLPLIGTDPNFFATAPFSFLLRVGSMQLPRLVTVPAIAATFVDPDAIPNNGNEFYEITTADVIAAVQGALDSAFGGGVVTAGDPDTDDKISLSAGGNQLEITRTLTLNTVHEITLAELAGNAQVFEIEPDMTSEFTVELTLKADAGLEETDTANDYRPEGTVSATVDPFDQGLLADGHDVEVVTVDTVPTTGDAINKAKFALVFGGDMDPEMLDFNVVGAPEILDIVNQLGTWLNRLAASQLFTAFELPFADATLSDLLPFGDMVSDRLLIDDGDDGLTRPGDDGVADKARLLKWVLVDGDYQLLPTFTNAQQLEQRLAEVTLAVIEEEFGPQPQAVKDAIIDLALDALDASYDVAGKALTYNLSLEHDLVPQGLQPDGFKVPLDFELELDPLASIVTEGNLFITAESGLDFTLGVVLGDAAVPLTGGASLAEVNDGDGVELNTNLALTTLADITPIVGRLTGSALFTVTVQDANGVQSYQVKLLRAPQTDPLHPDFGLPFTDDNLTFQDLVDDLNAALTAAGVAGIVAEDSQAGTGEGDTGRVVLRATDPDIVAFQVESSSGNRAYSELGLQPESAATVFLVAPLPMAGPVPGVQVQFSLDVTYADDSNAVDTVTVRTTPSGSNESETADNAVLNDLINDVNAALADSDFAGQIVASRAGGHLVLSAVNANVRSFAVADVANAAAKLGLDESAASDALAAQGVNTGFVANALVAGVMLRGQDVPSNPFGRLTDDVTFTLNGEALTVTKAATAANSNITDLVRDINDRIDVNLDIRGKIVAENDGFHLRFRALDPDIARITVGGLSAAEAARLGIQDGDSGGTADRVDLTVVANRLAPVSYGVSEDVSFTVNVERTDPTDNQTWTGEISAFSTLANRSLYDLAADINQALNGGFVAEFAGPGVTADDNPLIAVVQGQRIVIGLKTLAGGSRLIGDPTPAGDDVTGFSITALGNTDVATQLELVAAGLGAKTSHASKADFVVFFADGTSAPVALDDPLINPGLTVTDFKLVGTVDNLIDEMQAQAPKLKVSIAPDGSGLVLVDDSGVAPNAANPFQVIAVNGSPAALQLGILRSDTTQLDIGQYAAEAVGNPDGRIEGGQLATVDLLDRVFLEDPDLDAELALRTDGVVSAEANFGFVGVLLESAADQTLYSAELEVPFLTDGDGRVVLAELFGALAQVTNLWDLVDLPLLTTSTTDFSFDLSIFPDTLSGIVDIPASAEIQFDIQSLGQLQKVDTDPVENPGLDAVQLDPAVNLVDVVGVDLEELANFSGVDFDDVLTGLAAIADFLDQFGSFGFLDQQIPLLGFSLNEVLEIADRFADAVQVVTVNPAGGLQLLRQALGQAFGLPEFANNAERDLYFSERGIPDPTDLVGFVLRDLVGGSGEMDLLRIDLRLPVSFSQARTVDLDLGNVDFLGQTLPVDLQGGAGLQVSGYLDARLSFGVDLDDPSNIYLFDDATGLDGAVTASASNLAFTAAIGPMGVFIKDGNAQATVTFGMDDVGDLDDNRILLDLANIADLVGLTASATTFGPEFVAELSATLPVFFPTDSEFLGDIVLDLTGPNALVLLSPTFGLPDLTDPSVLMLPDFSDIDLASLNPFGGANAAQLLDTLDFFLQGLQDILDGEVFGIPLPLVGDQLASGADFIEDLRRDILAPMRPYIEQAPDLGEELIRKLLFSLLGPGSAGQMIAGQDLHVFLGLSSPFDGVGLLVDYLTGSDNPADISVDDVLSTVMDTNSDMLDDDFLWRFRVGQTYSPSVDIDFDLGFPALGLSMNTGLDVNIAWDLALGLGLSTADGAFVFVGDHRGAGADEELLITLDVDVPPPPPGESAIEGRLGFLQLLVNESNAPDDKLEMEGRSTFFHAQFDVDLFKTDAMGLPDLADDRISFSELGALDTQIGLEAEAEVNLDVRVQFNDRILPETIAAILPALNARFALDWATGEIFADGFDFAGSLEFIGFRDVNLDMGSFLGEFLGPVIGKIAEVTEPLQPIIEVLTTPIPVLSDLAGGPVTLIDIAGQFGEVNPDMIYAIADIITLVNKIGSISDGAQLLVPLGDLTLFDDSLPDVPGFEDLASNLTLPGFRLDGSNDDFDLGGFLSTTSQTISDGFDQLLNSASGDAEVKSLSNTLVNKTAPGAGNFIFPLFDDPTLAFGLLFGQDIPLVEYDLPPFGMDFQMALQFPIWGPLFARISGGLGITIDLAFGYDTRGVREFALGGFKNPLDLIAGFYLNDTDQPGGVGADVPELILRGEIFAGAEINLGIASAGVEGGIIFTSNFDLFDNDGNGKVYVDELVGNFLYEWNYGAKVSAPLAIFDVSFEIAAQLRAFIEFLTFGKTFEITPPIVLVEFAIPFEREPFLATERGDGAVVLNMGPNAGGRLNGDTRDIGETMFVKSLSNSEIAVWSSGAGGFGVSESAAQTYRIGANDDGERIIIVDGGDGNDHVDLSGVTHDIKVIVNAGAGDDVIVGGQFANEIRGGLGDDHLTGGEGPDVIIGEGGNDTIFGEAGRDWLFGDGGRISLVNDADGNGIADDPTTRFRSLASDTDGDDEIHGGDEASPGDIIFGGGGLDTLFGDAGDDLIFGDGGYFDFDPATGDVPMAGGYVDFSKVTARGPGAKDRIQGNAGNDAILGGAGDDYIDGGADSDLASGGLGFDTIYGGSGGDLLFGDFDDDTIFGYRDPVVPADFTADAADNVDPDGEDYVEGGQGNDYIRGQGAVDTLHGNRGADIIFGDEGNDIIGAGVLAAPWIAPADRLTDNEAGADIIFGGADDDTIDSGEGSDIVFGDEGLVAYLDFADTTGLVTVTGSRIRTDAGGDHKLIGDGDETILIDGYDAHDDEVSDLPSAPLTPDLYATVALASDGSDTIVGGDGRDIIFGGGDSGTFDTIYGDFDPAAPPLGPRPTGQDTILGDGGRVELFGRRFAAAEATSNILFDGVDRISGNDNGDYIFGGGDEDLIWGFEDPAVGSNLPLQDDQGQSIPDNDVILGDNGRIEFDPTETKNRIRWIYTTVVEILNVPFDSGRSDEIYGQFGADVILGGLNSSQDVLVGGLDDDVILGDQGELVFDGIGDGTLGLPADPAILSLDTLDLIRSFRDGFGGGDKISGVQGDDILIGGTGGDEMYGDADGVIEPLSGAEDGEDVMLGDNGDVFLLGTEGRLTAKVAAMTQGTAVDLITTTDEAESTGGADTLSGNAQADVMLGGVNDGGVDTMYGDRAAPTAASLDLDLDDILLGDNGLLDFTFELDTDRNTLDLIRSFEDARGGVDVISGSTGADVAIGGTAGDTIYGDDAAANAGARDLGDMLLGDNADVFLVDAQGAAGGDAKLVLDAAVFLIRTTDEDHAITPTGGEDTISGNADGDIIAGGVEGDTLYGDRLAEDATHALDGDDTILGDNGAFEWLSGGRLAEITGIDIAVENPALWAKYGTAVADTDLTTLDLVTTEQPNNGGRDFIRGDDASDFVFGGTDADTIYGDDGDLESPDATGDGDLLFGDHGRVYPQFSTLADFNSRNFFAIHIADGDGGEGDRMWGEEGDDSMLGQQGDDRMWGGGDDDDMTGGHNVSGGRDELSAPAVEASLFIPIDVPDIDDVNDLMDGGGGDDAMAGDNAVIWRRGDDLSPRFRALTAASIYTTDADSITANVNTFPTRFDGESDPADAVGRDITMLDHDDVVQGDAQGRFGNDAMAGGAEADVMFGQLGNDLMQGDGNIDQMEESDLTFLRHRADVDDSGVNPDTDETLYFNIPEAASDGDDYLEGNGGSDLMYGGLGQDDLIGGSSALFGLEVELQRPDDADFIFGGASTAIARNDIGATHTEALASEDPATHVITTAPDGHARDADFIMGDNANVFRLVQGGASGMDPDDLNDLFLDFNYDDVYGLQVIPRAMQQLDYHLGGADYAKKDDPDAEYVGGAADPDGAGGPAPADNGAGDLIHGESGDDVIFGMTGSDVIFGEGQDDDIVGGYGHDWISAGTGQDGVLGDDGLILTSRNSTDGEPLNGIAGLLDKDPRPKYADGNVLDEVIKTPGQIQYAVINLTGQLKKTADLVPFSFDPDWIAHDDEYPDNQDGTPFADDIIFGGLGTDWLHGGSGDDAMSGAEALEHAYVQTYDGMGNPNGVLDLGYVRAGDPANLNLMNPGNVLAFNPVDEDGWQTNNRKRAGEFALYDEYDPRRTILLTPLGELYKADGGVEGVDFFQFLLNFDETEGVVRPEGEVPKAVGQQTETYPEVNDDGKDAMFGDLGNDWIVGGTGRDNTYGGWGNDLLNADDDHDGHDDVNQLNEVPDTHPFYEDRAYGGAGRDVLIGNTGGDRLIDWVGEYNSYLVPYAPFGMASVSRTMQPFLHEFLYALSAGDGADPTRPDDTGADPLRNGEPEGEMGLVLQKDFAWQAQTGAPADPQAGNIPGGHRDVLRSAGFNDETSQGFSVDAGTWQMASGRYYVEPTVLGGEAISVWHHDQVVPSYFELTATISTVKPIQGYKANSYVVFDYYGPEDFKFAGVNSSTNKVEIGERTAAGWEVAEFANMQIKDGRDYNVLLALNGTTATIVVNNAVTLTHGFAPRLDVYGLAHNISEGMVGLGADNAKASIANMSLQVLPPSMTHTAVDDFDAGMTLVGATSGQWSVSGGQLSGAPQGLEVNAIASGNLGVGPAYVLKLQTAVATAATGGFVFDLYAHDDFKWAAWSKDTGEVMLGYHTPREGWVVEKSVSLQLAGPAQLSLTLKGSTASLMAGGQVAASHAYNAVVTDGAFGLLARGGSAAFESLLVMTDDPRFAQAAPSGSAVTAGSDAEGAVTAGLTASAADAVVEAGMARWSAALGLAPAVFADLEFVIGDLPGLTLAEVAGARVTLDVDAAGHGWFVDPTPMDDGEFPIRADAGLRATPDSDAHGRMDLLSAVMHELGHVLGYGHGDGASPSGALMDAELETGLRVAHAIQPGDGTHAVPGQAAALTSGEPAAGDSLQASPAPVPAPAAADERIAAVAWLFDDERGDFVRDAETAPEAARLVSYLGRPGQSSSQAFDGDDASWLIRNATLGELTGARDGDARSSRADAGEDDLFDYELERLPRGQGLIEWLDLL